MQRVVDALVWVLAVPISTFLRYDGHFAPMQHGWVALFAVLGATAQLLAGQVLGLYHRRWRYGSFDELMAVAVSSVAAILPVVHGSSVDPRRWAASFGPDAGRIPRPRRHVLDQIPLACAVGDLEPTTRR